MAFLLGSSKIAYFPVPKCACTSLKQFFFGVENGFAFRRFKVQGRDWGIHNLILSTPFEGTDHAAIETWARVAVIRDPISRLASCYANKVVSRRALAAVRFTPAQLEAGLNASPSFAEFLRDLEAYRAVSTVIRQHSQPLSHFLGTDPGYFTHLFTMGQILELVAMVAAQEGAVPELPHRMQSDSAGPIEALSPAERRRIESAYAEDLEIFGGFM